MTPFEEYWEMLSRGEREEHKKAQAYAKWQHDKIMREFWALHDEVVTLIPYIQEEADALKSQGGNA